MNPRPARPARRRPLAATTLGAFVAWLALGAAIAVWWWWSWMRRQSLREVETGIEAFYTSIGLPAGWWSAGDSALHFATALVATLWLGLGARLFAPRLSVAGPGLVVLVVLLADEAAQEHSVDRSASLGDVAWGLAGLVVGWGALLLWQRCRPHGDRRTDRSRSARRLDSAGQRE